MPRLVYTLVLKDNVVVALYISYKEHTWISEELRDVRYDETRVCNLLAFIKAFSKLKLKKLFRKTI